MPRQQTAPSLATCRSAAAANDRQHTQCCRMIRAFHPCPIVLVPAAHVCIARVVDKQADSVVAVRELSSLLVQPRLNPLRGGGGEYKLRV